MSKLDIQQNRAETKYRKEELFKRFLWGLITPFFRLSPRCFFGWRCFLLRLFGAKVGEKVHVYNTTVIFMPWNLEIGNLSAIGEFAYIYNLGIVKLGHKTTISQRVHLCAGSHDYEDATLPLIKLPIEVGDQAWIAADAFVGPGVKIGEGAVVGARAVVTKDVESWAVVVGNPSRQIKTRIIKSNTD